MAGALILLVSAIVAAIMGDDAPDWLPNASLIIGYGLLAYGFWLAMQARAAARDNARSSASEDAGPPKDER